MKLKILTLIPLSFILLFLFTTKAYASSAYSIATQFTFSEDMNIEEGFTLIKPYILYQNDTLSTNDFSFQATQEKDNQYHYTGIYPDGTSFSIHASIKIKENASGTYVEALKVEPYRQSIYVKGLKEGKTINDCLLECWQNRFVNLKDPTYNITNASPTNIFNHLTTFTISTGEVKSLQYIAVKEEEATTKPSTPSDPVNPDINEDNKPSNPSENNKPSEENNPQKPTDSSGNNNPTKPTNEAKESDPLFIALICIGAVIGFIFLFLLYKIIKGVTVWLKK